MIFKFFNKQTVADAAKQLADMKHEKERNSRTTEKTQEIVRNVRTRREVYWANVSASSGACSPGLSWIEGR